MLAAALLLFAPPQASELTDAQILAFAATSFDKAEKEGLRELLGYHHGRRVIVEYPCSDQCPDYTTRLIFYDVPLSECRAIEGVVRNLVVPMGIGAGRRHYCVPGVLGDPEVYDPSPYR